MRSLLVMMQDNRKASTENVLGYLPRTMETLTKRLVHHNEAREDYKTIYREITKMEAVIGSTVRSVVARDQGGLRLSRGGYRPT